MSFDKFVLMRACELLTDRWKSTNSNPRCLVFSIMKLMFWFVPRLLNLEWMFRAQTQCLLIRPICSDSHSFINCADVLVEARLAPTAIYFYQKIKKLKKMLKSVSKLFKKIRRLVLGFELPNTTLSFEELEIF